ncbi:2-oxoglutarate dehydrogenase complex dihydrolipoyllysine-residue succinyltransferase [Blastopirellula sp. JC732]|uniref:Dihydrolipoyllysine-residue succinyltransferase n=1 Tax=Blastopirellula sediminis TaxID=2894196 RepID=A0A9X1MKN2_9BACT|nr:2-oxoglutarate dehydrogenase complex dihydrolipoyllysine-residue succinyltransferase [Blastopirellula sediminis]MCC9608744.1 2-oxoglutarate dehydrogenase complex dihydrolipoyllysine-residue succinyltransferase [Blastopirellula sediminis]MCC9628479.1 2-oxoglutarate dehydrogenase complex dihydrolipoyllysine-residue succinyltransferase [Blastopirellula sediminis]
MSIELKVPDPGESIQEVQIGRWLKKEGDAVKEDEFLVELETDKASMEMPAPTQGVLREIFKREGDLVTVGEVIGILDDGAAAEAPAAAPAAKPAAAEVEKPAPTPEPTPAPAPSPRGARPTIISSSSTAAKSAPSTNGESENAKYEHTRPEPKKPAPAPVPAPVKTQEVAPRVESNVAPQAGEKIVPMPLIRRRIAETLKGAQQNAALLTTVNQVDMSNVMALRKKYGEWFLNQWGVKLGFMSFFVKATIDALKQQPALNAEIRDGDKIVYRDFYHIGVAIGSKKGLVVPVLRNAERMRFAEIELAIADFAARANENRLSAAELSGGTFTISNGGVYGSLLSTPIVNPPQSGVLGMHSIEERPVARNGEVVIRPMMYLALTYDHCMVDGREAVLFLKRICDAIEEPARMLLEA